MDTEGHGKSRAEMIESGSCFLGCELGSTRIKATLISPAGEPLASGAWGWENTLVDGYWTYGLDEVWAGAAGCLADLQTQVSARYGTDLRRIAAGGISAMMHGYLAFDKEGNLLTPFRTWRNTTTGPAAAELTGLFRFAIPQRWSIAHLHQAVLDGEVHVEKIAFITTLAGYVHWKLTGEKVLGIGDASGMFPIDPKTGDYDQTMVEAYDSRLGERNLPWKLRDILPEVKPAGEYAGSVTGEGARLLDPSGEWTAGLRLCPPEGDAGTGMVATNSIRPRTGNVSVGTSVFAMVVLEDNLQRVHEEIDMVTTPDGKPVAMAHANNGSSDLDAWMGVFGQVSAALGHKPSPDELYGRLLPLILESDAEAGGLLSIGYVSGEHITGFTEGRPLLVRNPEGNFTLANLLRSLVFSSFCALRTGLDILTGEEGVKIERLQGHGGIFRTPEVGQRILAAATGVPVGLPGSAGEGGSWGMALLASFMERKTKDQSLQVFLDEVPGTGSGAPVVPEARDRKGFDAYFARYHAGLAIEREALRSLR